MYWVSRRGLLWVSLLLCGCSSVQIYTGTVPHDVSAKEFRKIAQIKCASERGVLLDTIYTRQPAGAHHVVVMCDTAKTAP